MIDSHDTAEMFIDKVSANRFNGNKFQQHQDRRSHSKHERGDHGMNDDKQRALQYIGMARPVSANRIPSNVALIRHNLQKDKPIGNQLEKYKNPAGNVKVR